MASRILEIIAKDQQGVEKVIGYKCLKCGTPYFISNFLEIAGADNDGALSGAEAALRDAFSEALSCGFEFRLGYRFIAEDGKPREIIGKKRNGDCELGCKITYSYQSVNGNVDGMGKHLHGIISSEELKHATPAKPLVEA